MFDEFGINAGYVEDLHARWQQSPDSVEENWRRFFEGVVVPPPPSPSTVALPLPDTSVNGWATNGNGAANGNGVAHSSANGNGANGSSAVNRPPAAAVAYREAVRETVIAATELQSRVAHLVNGYRVRGHLFANLDPLETPSGAAPELELSHFGLTDAELDKTFSTAGMS